MIAPHFVNDFLSAMAGRVGNGNDQFDRMFSSAHILRMPLEIRQHKANEGILLECLTSVKGDGACQPPTPRKTVIATVEALIMCLTIGGTCSRDEAEMDVSWSLS
jgi:hypothetical protein